MGIVRNYVVCQRAKNKKPGFCFPYKVNTLQVLILEANTCTVARIGLAALFRYGGCNAC